MSSYVSEVSSQVQLGELADARWWDARTRMWRGLEGMLRWNLGTMFAAAGEVTEGNRQQEQTLKSDEGHDAAADHD